MTNPLGNTHPTAHAPRDRASPGDAYTLDHELIRLLIHQHNLHARPAFDRLWDYYRNELDFHASGNEHDRPYTCGQRQGLPGRLRDPRRQREVVIENDIGWRINALVDFMFAKPVGLQSLAADPNTAAAIERILEALIEANGGTQFFQNLALLGAVYGHVDLLPRIDQLPPTGLSESQPHPPNTPAPTHSAAGRAGNAPFKPESTEAADHLSTLDRAVRFASQIRIETVEAPRAIPLLCSHDYRELDGYILHYHLPQPEVESAGFLSRLIDRTGRPAGRQAHIPVTEIWTDRAIRIYHGDRLVTETPNRLGRLPVVHIQNLPQPYVYEGLSEVEPLIPLQDELNTRLSDRANRVTFQSFRMYLGKGIEGFLDRPVRPGQMWATDNPEASIETFGGDAASPSEDAHIAELREAMDKTSTVTPVAAGLLRAKVGNLTSENALRIVMMGMLARTEKKRITYGEGITQLARIVLDLLDQTGLLPTAPEDRRLRLHWPSPLPENTTQRLQDAEIKQRLGVPAQTILAELGYPTETQNA